MPSVSLLSRTGPFTPLVDGMAATPGSRAHGARPVLVNGQAGAAWLPKRELRVLFQFAVSEEKIVAIGLIADPDTINGLDITSP